MRWNVLAKLKKDQDFLDLLLKNRGVDLTEKGSFLNPPLVSKLIKELPEEFKDGAKLARKMVQKAISDNLPIVVHGDYDTDGICATAILVKVLRDDLGHENTFSFIPNRFENGFGITESSIDDAIKKVEAVLGEVKKGLLISVDTGITAIGGVKYAKKQGFEVIITDHHQKPNKLPPADCIVWDGNLVGCGVSWVMGRVLGSTDKQSIALAALATAGDMQPLVGLNRSIVKEGLHVFNTNPPPGLKILHQVAGRSGREITTYDLGWVLSPRLNAAGRMGDSQDSLDLLLKIGEEELLKSAQKLNSLNKSRQDKTVEMFDLIEKLDSEKLPKVIVTASEDYHEGLVGLVAAKLVQTYHRPAIVISLEGDLGKSSVRSIKGVNIISFLREFEDLFIDLGGHPMAAGFSIKRKHLGKLKEKVIKLANDYISDEQLVPSMDVDLEISLDTVDMEFIEQVNQLEPFGVGNKTPLFISSGVGVTGLNIVGKEKTHLSLRLMSNKKAYRAIFFNGGPVFDDLSVGDRIDLVYAVERNEFKGKNYVSLVVRDLKKVKE